MNKNLIKKILSIICGLSIIPTMSLVLSNSDNVSQKALQSYNQISESDDDNAEPAAYFTSPIFPLLSENDPIDFNSFSLKSDNVKIKNNGITSGGAKEYITDSKISNIKLFDKFVPYVSLKIPQINLMNTYLKLHGNSASLSELTAKAYLREPKISFLTVGVERLAPKISISGEYNIHGKNASLVDSEYNRTEIFDTNFSMEPKPIPKKGNKLVFNSSAQKAKIDFSLNFDDDLLNTSDLKFKLVPKSGTVPAHYEIATAQNKKMTISGWGVDIKDNSYTVLNTFQKNFNFANPIDILKTPSTDFQFPNISKIVWNFPGAGKDQSEDEYWHMDEFKDYPIVRHNMFDEEKITDTYRNCWNPIMKQQSFRLHADAIVMYDFFGDILHPYDVQQWLASPVWGDKNSILNLGWQSPAQKVDYGFICDWEKTHLNKWGGRDYWSPCPDYSNYEGSVTSLPNVSLDYTKNKDGTVKVNSFLIKLNTSKPSTSSYSGDDFLLFSFKWEFTSAQGFSKYSVPFFTNYGTYYDKNHLFQDKNFKILFEKENMWD